MKSQVAILAAAALAGGCVHAERSDPDPREVLQANLSHGLGVSVFDSPLMADAAGAEVLVAARRCAPSWAVLKLSIARGAGPDLIAALEGQGLLLRRGEALCTAFPILMDGDRAVYDALTRETAAGIAEEIGPLILSAFDDLDARGLGAWKYHFLWSQVFDSQFAWNAMVRQELVPPIDRAIAWVIYPSHPYRSGTSYYPNSEIRDYWMMTTWRTGAQRATDAADAMWPDLYAASVEQQPPEDGDLEQLRAAGWAGANEEIRIPVLRPGDPSLLRAEAIALRHVALMGERLPTARFAALTGVDPQYAFAMAYHDVSWSIVQRLVESSAVTPPPSLQPEPPTPARWKGRRSLFPSILPSSN